VGNEVKCTAWLGKQESEGKALLETSEILFRGDFCLKIPFSTVKSAKAVDGELRLQTAEGLAVFQLGAAAEKWCEKILHPKSRIEKLGVKPGAKSFFGRWLRCRISRGNRQAHQVREQEQSCSRFGIDLFQR